MKTLIKAFLLIITVSFIIVSCGNDDDNDPVPAPDPIDAMDDNYTITAEEGVDGITLSNVLDNDVINGAVVNPANVTITPNADGPLTVNAGGTVTVAENTTEGAYTVTYTVCENGTSPANSNCDVATVTVMVPAPDSVFAFEAGDYDISWNGNPFKAQLTLTDENTLEGGFCVNNDINNCDDIGPIIITRNNDTDVTFNFMDINCGPEPDAPGVFNGEGTIIGDNQYSFIVSGEDCFQTYTNVPVIFTKI